MVSSRLSLSRTSLALSVNESDADEVYQQQVEDAVKELSGGKSSNFLRLVNRSHVCNASSHSISSVISNACKPERQLSHRSRHHRTPGVSRTPLTVLYDMLIQPLEQELSAFVNNIGCTRKVILIVQGDLIFIPFASLRSNQMASYLSERFHLFVAPSLISLEKTSVQPENYQQIDCFGAVVAGSPRLPQNLMRYWQWGPLPSMESECRMVSELLGCKSLTQDLATKETVIQAIKHAEIIHFATHISWRLSGIVLASSAVGAAPSTNFTGSGRNNSISCGDSGGMMSDDEQSVSDNHSLTNYLLTASDIINLSLSARVVVLSSGYTDEKAGRINADGVIGLTRALLVAGVKCVVFSLWSVPELACRTFLKTFYAGLLQGLYVSVALSQAMQTVRATHQLAHPSNWAGWVVIGCDAQLTSRISLMGHSLRDMLRKPAESREAMRTVLHLVR